MDLDRFQRNLDTFGADFRRWPEYERHDAERLRDVSLEARQRWRAARRLDELFALDRAASGDSYSLAHHEIADAALRSIRRSRRPSGLRRRLFSRLPRPIMGAALGASLAAGLLAGLLVGPLFESATDGGMHAVTALLDWGVSSEELF